MTETSPPLTKVGPSRAPLLASRRHQRQARKWPWAWWCTGCAHAYGAAKTREEAQAAAQRHETAAHASK